MYNWQANRRERKTKNCVILDLNNELSDTYKQHTLNVRTQLIESEKLGKKYNER